MLPIQHVFEDILFSLGGDHITLPSPSDIVQYRHDLQPNNNASASKLLSRDPLEDLLRTTPLSASARCAVINFFWDQDLTLPECSKMEASDDAFFRYYETECRAT